MQHRGSARNHIALGMRASVLAIVAALLVPLCLAATAEIALADSAEPTSVVVIDAGHQGRGDSRREPIGPGSKKTKPRVSWGTSGVVSRKAESAINLKVALKLRSELREAWSHGRDGPDLATGQPIQLEAREDRERRTGRSHGSYPLRFSGSVDAWATHHRAFQEPVDDADRVVFGQRGKAHPRLDARGDRGSQPRSRSAR